MSQLHQLASHFVTAGTIATVELLGNGNINSTFLVKVTASCSSAKPSSAKPSSAKPSPAEPSPAKRFVMQQINADVFPQPELVIQNMTVLSQHLQNHQPQHPTHQPSRRWEMPHIIPTRQGDPFFRDEAGGYWRAITFIENARVLETIQTPEQAKEVGYGLAMFHRLISDLPTEQLADTLEGFHITPQYLAAYEQVLANWDEAAWKQANPVPEYRYEEVQRCIQFIADRQAWVSVLEDAKAAGQLKLRPIHGDPKINNIMLGPNDQAVSLIDLDTVKPGLIHYDIGDCLRSGCNQLGEDTKIWESVEFNLQIAEAMLNGYLSLASDFFTEADYQYLYDAIRLISFELGLRFFTDYLAGDRYFKITHRMHNLDRALVQFQLTASIEAQETQIKNIIESLK
ncbi:MAG: aminoglycoside phosphotransferase family protein [Cyanobacteria bacterium J06621_11]